MADVKTVAEYMTRVLAKLGELYQPDIAEIIWKRFGDEFVSEGRGKCRGYLKINKEVLKAFRAMNPRVEWDRESFSWRVKANAAR